MDVSITLSDDIGEIKLHHTFNGAVPVGRTWMICNGDIVNQTNYDALHGSGAYVRDCVASSPINGKYLPNMVDKFPIGSANTSQNGSSAITSEGLTGHTLNTTHNHKWLNLKTLSSSNDQSYDSSGAAVDFSNAGNTKNSGVWTLPVSNVAGERQPNVYYTEKVGSTSESIKPESIQVIYKMKVI